MKLIIFSDIHGNSYALEAFIEEIKGITYDYVVFCGDIFGYYYNQKEIITQLAAMDRLIWLRGNHDTYFLKLFAEQNCERGREQLKYCIDHYGHCYEHLEERYSREEAALLAACPSKYILNTGECKIGIFHGTPEDSLEGRLYPDKPVLNPKLYHEFDIVILGHTHCRMKRWEKKTLVINSGSLGQPRDGNGYGYAELDTWTKEVTFHTVQINKNLLYQQIERFDPDLKKLKEVLERKSEKNTSDGY